MDRMKFFKTYQANAKLMENEKSFEYLSNIFQSILKKRTKSKQKTFSFFDENLIKLISEPSDHQVSICNTKEACLRMIYTNLSRNEIIHALINFLHLIHNFNPSSCFLWRTGFHILCRIGDTNSMNDFFNALLDFDIWDPSNMIYEFMLYLLESKNYSGIQDVYMNSYSSYFRNKRFIREPEMEILHHFIKLTVAVSYYAIWKLSLKSGKEDEESRIQSELEFKELYVAIKKKLVVDSFILNYLDLLECQQKFIDAFQILKLYYETSPNNIHASEYLLDFLIRNQKYITESVTEQEVMEIRAQYIEKQIHINPDCSSFVLQAFKTHIEDLNEEENHEDIVRLLFKYLGDCKWQKIEWPWRYLLNSVKHVGESSNCVQDIWLFIADLWNYMIFSCPQNGYIKELKQLLS